MAELDHSEGAVADDHHLALRLPTAHEVQQDIGVLGLRAMAPPEPGAGGWRKRRDAEERQRPRPAAPRDRHQHGQAEPVMRSLMATCPG